MVALNEGHWEQNFQKTFYPDSQPIQEYFLAIDSRLSLINLTT